MYSATALRLQLGSTACCSTDRALNAGSALLRQSKPPTTEASSILCIRLWFGKNTRDVCLCSVHRRSAQWLATGSSSSSSSSHALPGQHGLQIGSEGQSGRYVGSPLICTSYRGWDWWSRTSTVHM